MVQVKQAEPEPPKITKVVEEIKEEKKEEIKQEIKEEVKPKEEIKFESQPQPEVPMATPEPELINIKAPVVSEAEIRKLEELKNLRKAGKLKK